MKDLNKKTISSFSSLSGFTILELLVVFSLMTVISGIGFLSFVSYSRNQILIQAASDLRQAVELARFNAQSNVKPAVCGSDSLESYTLKFCTHNNCLGISGTTDGQSYVMLATCGAQNPLILSKKLPQNVTFVDAGPTPCQNIVFHSVNPLVSGGPCDVRISGYSNYITFSIDSQGYVY